MRLAFGVWLILGTVVFAEPAAAWRDHRLTVSGVTSAANVRVVVGSGTAEAVAQRPAVTGEWSSADKDAYAFEPKYPLLPGAKYRVFFSEKLFADVTVPATRVKTPPVLKHVFPSGDTIPENTLRLYLVFSKPMSRGEAYARVKILDETGKAVKHPFLELDDELWEAGQTRLTLYLDPGRIKKEVGPRLQFGPVFEAGKKYTLVVDGKWPDANGITSGNELRKAFTAAESNAKAPTPGEWKITAPATPADPVTVTFPRTMDEALLRSFLSVRTDDDKPVAGTITLEKGETVWKFTPAKPWTPGGYALRLDSRLEDVSGNAIDQPFEVEETTDRKKKPVTVKLIPFQVGGR